MSIFIWLLIIPVYIGIIALTNKLNLPELDLFKFKKPNKPLSILVVFPHPDDETMTVGGTIAKYANQLNVKVKVVSITKGEAGETHGLCTPDQLGATRSQELVEAMGALGVRDVQLLNFRDGSVDKDATGLRSQLRDLFNSFQPDVVITYDHSGLYPHPDHIVLSEVVTDLIHNEFKDIKLLYTTLPPKILARAGLPDSIDLYGQKIDLHNAEFAPTKPQYKCVIGLNTFAKNAAIRAHKTQDLEHGLPIPLWLYTVFMIVEYFSDGN